MAYNKTNWVDYSTPVNAENLNKIEDGIKALETLIEVVQATVEDKADLGDIVNIQGELDGKADLVHTHIDLEAAINEKANTVHSHVDLEEAIDEKADLVHTHTELEDDIAAKADLVHTHIELEEAINEKADATHEHNDLDTRISELEAKQDVDLEPLNIRVTSLEGDVSNKADSTHNHDTEYASVFQFEALETEVGLNTSAIGQATGDIASLLTRVEAVENAIVDLIARVEALETI